MRKVTFTAIVIAVIMLLALSASAAVGTVVYASKTDTAPNLEQIDSSWGEPAIVINSKSPNTELYRWWNEGNRYLHGSKLPDLWTRYSDSGMNLEVEDYDVELYYLWDSKYLYFGLKTEDHVYAGAKWPWEGDGVQMWVQPFDGAEADGVLYAGVNTHDETNVKAGVCDFAFTLDLDDYSTIHSNFGYEHGFNAASECDCNIYTDTDGELHCIIAIPLRSLGFNTKNDLSGAEIATAVLRVSSVGSYDVYSYAGWLSWGKYFSDCTAESLNTVVLSAVPVSEGNTSSDTMPPETEGTKVETPINLEGVSSWALTEVEAGIKEGLVPENLQANYTSPVSRGAVAGMFINLIEKATGKTIDEVMAEKGVSITEGVFEDTTDRNVLAANALGIINGTSKTKFSPNGTLKRAQIAAIINRVARVLGIETEGFTHEFNDITDNYAWADSELGWPVHAGIINGVSQGRFNPGGDLTTEQAILITYRALGALK
jgi:hypothetical protein